MGSLKLMAGNANPFLAQLIATELGQGVESTQVDRFDDGEVKVDLDCVVRGTDVFVIQSICQSLHGPMQRPCRSFGFELPSESQYCTYQSINDSLMELLVMIDAARRASSTEDRLQQPPIFSA